MLVAADGSYAGLLSGGCLEGDLREHALQVLAGGAARRVSYDMRGPEDLLWGLGVGCEGAMDIVLLRLAPEDDWQPLAHLAAAHATHARTAVALTLHGEGPQYTGVTVTLPGRSTTPALAEALEAACTDVAAGWLAAAAPGRTFVLPLALPPRLLLLGAGPDAVPIVDIAGRLGWKIVLVDHRPAYAQAAHFAAAERVLLARPEELRAVLGEMRVDAAVVMSHHLPSDLAYLRELAATAIPYVGLLGPAARREKLLADLGPRAAALRGRLRAPVGLALGGRGPESIALAIVAEVHACLHGQEGRPFSAAVRTG